MLEFDNVTVRLGGVRILRNVSFRIEKAETLALIGANGAGKTTTLRSIMGFPKVEGKIVFDGTDLTKTKPYTRAGMGIGYAAEDRRLFSAFTVGENLRMPGQVQGFSSDEIDRRLERVYEVVPELREMADRPAGSVSGGQGKMVALGRALMTGDRLIMLDEPFQGLAPVLAENYSKALRRVRDADDSLTLIITESNPRLLKKFADRALVVERGEIRAGELDSLEAA